MPSAAVRRVLLTGARGFIGRQTIAPLLREGFEVHIISRSPLDAPGVHEHRVDLFDEPSVVAVLNRVRPSHLVHLAWHTEPPEYWHSPLNTTWESRSLHLFDSFVMSGGTRLIGVGTCAEYEWGSSVLKEGVTPELPSTPYGIAKLSLQRRASALAEAAGISFSWARFFFLFGPHERKERFVSSIIDPLLRESPAYCRNGDLLRDFLYVEDAAESIVALAVSDVRGIVNVASGVATQLGTLAREIGSLMQAPNLVQVTPGDATSAQPTALIADVSRLHKEVGWSPRFELTEALEKTIFWRSVQGRINAA